VSDLDSILPADFPNRQHLIDRIGTVEKLAKGFQEADSFINSSVRAPVQSKDPEDWAAFYRKLGAPAEVEGYQVPGGDATFQAIVGKLREPARKAGLTTDQWNALFGSAATEMESELAGIKDVQANWKNEAKSKYGDDFQDKAALAETTMAEIIGDEKIVDSLKVAGLHQNPAFMEAMLKVSEARQDDTAPSGTGGGDSAPDYMGMALKAREMVKSGVLSDERHVDFEKSMGEFIAISQVLDAAPEGFRGPDDPRLMPQWYPKA
jgi:hypothetical protein